MKVGAYDVACRRENAARKKNHKKFFLGEKDFFTIDDFVGLFLKINGDSMVAI